MPPYVAYVHPGTSAWPKLSTAFPHGRGFSNLASDMGLTRAYGTYPTMRVACRVVEPYEIAPSGQLPGLCRAHRLCSSRTSARPKLSTAFPHGRGFSNLASDMGLTRAYGTYPTMRVACRVVEPYEIAPVSSAVRRRAHGVPGWGHYVAGRRSDPEKLIRSNWCKV